MPTEIDRSARDYFQHHRANPDKGAHFGNPIRDNVSGCWTIPMSWRLSNKDGSISNILEHQKRDGEFTELSEDIVAAADPTNKTEGYIFERTRPHGATLEIVTVPRPDGGFVRTYTDVSERNRMDRALREVNSRLEALAPTDGLTGLANRRRYGHIAGDECLRRTAAMLKATLQRPGDLVARFGGEEFSVILPGTESEGARVVAERINRGVRDLAIPHESAGAGIATVSIGVATLEQRAVRFEPHHLVASADAALYAAKAAGRDRVHVADMRGGVFRFAASA